MRVFNIMQTSLSTVKPSATFEELILTQAEHKASRLIYVVNGKKSLHGIISPYDILRHILPEYLVPTGGLDTARALKADDDIFLKGLRENRGKTAADLMTSDYYSLAPDDPCVKASILIVDKRINALPVLEHGSILVGEVTRKTILRQLASSLTKEMANVP